MLLQEEGHAPELEITNGLHIICHFSLNDLSSTLWTRKTKNKFKTAAILTEMIQ